MSDGLRLIVMRHAKSVAATADAPDHGRILTSRGRTDAVAIGRRLATTGWTPDRALVSDATRTRETWLRMVDGFARPPEVSHQRQLYLPSIAAFEKVVRAAHGDAQILMVLSHNPGCEDLVKFLTDEMVTLTTANAVLLHTASSSWPEAMQSERFAIVDVLRPRPPVSGQSG